MSVDDPRDRLIVSLDCPPYDAYLLIRNLYQTITWVKIGRFRGGLKLLRFAHRFDMKVLLDLKLYDHETS
jgi:orotidine-5'-phosphate decarboxylase